MSRKRLLSLFAAFATLFAFRMAGAEEWTPTRAFRIFGKATSRGMPQSSVIALAQDTDGVMWIGTLDGAATFDGRTIEPVAAVKGAPLHGVMSGIVARRNGGVAISSQAGVHLYDGKAWKLVPSQKAIMAIAETTDGALWAADNEGALWRLRGDAWERHPEVKGAVALAPAADSSLWIATENNATHLRGNSVEPLNAPPLPGRPGAIVVAHDGKVWIATTTGTILWTSGNDGWHQAQFASWPRASFRALGEDRRGRIWAGSLGGGVAFGNAEMPWTTWNETNGPFAAGVMAFLSDREGNVWFGENAVGLVQWIGEAWSHRPLLDKTVPLTFGGFQISKGAEPHSLLVAAFEKGVLRLDDHGSRVFGRADGLTEDVRAIVEPERGFYIAGTRFGIFESRGGKPFTRVFEVPGGFVMGLYKSPDGKWYAGTNRMGVIVRDGDRWIPEASLNAHLVDMHVRGMTWRPNGELWIATLRGVTIFRNGTASQLTSKTVPEVPESVNAVLDVAADEVWVGGTGGVAILRRGRWQRMTEADGVPGQTVYSLARGLDGAVWAGGSGGVGRYLNDHWTVWDSREGLLNEECNLGGLLIDDDGSVYVGSLGGLAKFDPHVATLPPPPLKLTWRTTPPRDANGIARLKRGDRALHLKWSAAWLGSHPVQYRTRIPRLHEEWSAPTSEDHLDIENLSAGDWRIEVAARVEGSPASTEGSPASTEGSPASTEGSPAWTGPIALNVAVPPFWYETTLARIGFVALLIAIIYAAVRLRLRALRRHAAMLEEVVRQRTAELAETVDQLRDSEQRAHAASRAKSAFLANMSHELRTPLNGVLGFAQLLARRKDRDAEDREGLEIITKSGEHLLNLINDVLSLSKIEAGRVTLQREPFDLETLVREVESVVRFRADEKKLHLSYEIGSLPRAVIGDEGKVRQILINLAGNAVKFTEHGSVVLRASWSDGRARFEVADTGPGIAPAELPRLFEPFVQTDSGQRTKEGTGLGLALSRDLARLMNGDITVESRLGIGSTFRVELALPEAAPGAILTAKDRRRVVALAPGQGSVRVLVVDDTALNRTVLTRLLTFVGFEVRDASNGEDALAIWEAWQPHFIWMDKRMQGVDGLEATRRIRAREAAEGRKRVPIVALSASALEHERGEILAAGCDDFVAKPFRESMIFAKLREFLGVEYVYEDETTPATPRPGSVLLVDDDWICREVAQEILRGYGMSVTTATSGAEALDLAQKESFDLVLMDIHMPGMSGVETTRRLKSHPGMERVPVIAMSAEPADAEEMDDYILKPVEPESLGAALGRWLS